MSKIKSWLKRSVNFNFASVLLVAAILMILAIIFFIIYLVGEAQLSSLKSDINRIRSKDEIDDVEGYGLIIEIVGYGLGSIENSLALGFFVIIPAFISLVIAVFSVISRIVYSDVSQKRLMVYRIVSVFGYFIMLASCLLYSSIFFINIAVAIPAAIFDLLVISVFILGIRNTYSNKILKKGDDYIEKKETKEYSSDI